MPEEELKEEETLLDGDTSPQDPPEEEHEPPQDHPRFKEVYGKWKAAERKIDELERNGKETKEAIEAMRDHNQKLMEAITGVEDQISDINRPDPENDPEGYEKYIIAKAKREILKEKPAEVVKPKYTKAPGPVPKITVAEMEFAGEHEDYWQIIKEVNAEIATDATLLPKFQNTENPFEAAYRYGKARRRAKVTKQKALEEQGFVEGDTKTPSKKDIKLTEIEKRAAKGLGISEEKYLAQKKFTMGVK